MVQNFIILFSPLTSADKTSSCIALGRSLLRAEKQSLHPRDIQVDVFLVSTMFMWLWVAQGRGRMWCCRRGRGTTLCVCLSGELEIPYALLLGSVSCGRGKQLGNDCSLISAPLGVTLEVNLVSWAKSLQLSAHLKGYIWGLNKFLCLLIGDLCQKKA